MRVTTQSGTICPMEGKPRSYITDNIPTDVPDTMYYRRLIAEGSLILVDDKPQEPAAKASPKKEKGGKE
jgi:hypothetical protein